MAPTGGDGTGRGGTAPSGSVVLLGVGIGVLLGSGSDEKRTAVNPPEKRRVPPQEFLSHALTDTRNERAPRRAKPIPTRPLRTRALAPPRPGQLKRSLLAPEVRTSSTM